MITFQKVTKRFGTGKIGLSSINLSIEQGEFVFIVGPSGAGKTTLLRLVIRDLIPTEGEIVVNNWKLSQMRSSKVADLRRLIGMIFQDFKILSDRTAFENISLPLEILGGNRDKIEKQVLEALDTVGLVDKAQHFPVQFSAGELQRVALARAVVANPKIILADEPTGNLDPKTSWEIIDSLKKIHKKGHTVVVATHDQDIVNSLQERVISLEDGKVVKDLKKGKYS
jgi:cell division transport system ATP-binding protein